MPRLLLSEDDVDALDMLELLLTSAGFEVVAVATRADALQALERQAFDLVVADLMLETKEVDESWAQLDEFVKLARPAPVGIITGWKVEPERATRHGVAFVLTKPCTRNALITQIATALHVPELSDDRRARVRAYFMTIETQAYAQLGELCTDDVVYELPGTDPRFSHRVRGRAAFLAFAEQTFSSFREPHFELSAIRPLPGGAMAEYVGSWRDAESGEQRSLPGAVMFAFEGDRISRIGVRVDPERLE